METDPDLLIIGAGPFGLAMAAYAAHLGIDHAIVRRPMGFWKDNMPEGVYMRSASDWSLDQSLTAADVEPLSPRFYRA